jgi:hypothetical protein
VTVAVVDDADVKASRDNNVAQLNGIVCAPADKDDVAKDGGLYIAIRQSGQHADLCDDVIFLIAVVGLSLSPSDVIRLAVDYGDGSRPDDVILHPPDVTFNRNDRRWPLSADPDISGCSAATISAAAIARHIYFRSAGWYRVTVSGDVTGNGTMGAASTAVKVRSLIDSIGSISILSDSSYRPVDRYPVSLVVVLFARWPPCDVQVSIDFGDGSGQTGLDVDGNWSADSGQWSAGLTNSGETGQWSARLSRLAAESAAVAWTGHRFPGRGRNTVDRKCEFCVKCLGWFGRKGQFYREFCKLKPVSCIC